MRNLKKVLSLVLCVAVMLSVMVMGAGAAFSDQDKIENTEAVDACSALNILVGYEDGSFHPERNIKRSEVTKMICVALNGGKEPNVSSNAKPTFKDVRGTIHAWAEGYIESCVAQGIVDGVGGDRFAPAGNVTGAQLAKMLLVSLGYKAENEGFTGNAWETNVNVRATQKHLYDGLEKMDTSAAVTRDQASQMVWNAMQAYEVEYKTTIVTDPNGNLVTQVVVQDKVVGNNNDKITLVRDKYDAWINVGTLTKVDSNNITITMSEADKAASDAKDLTNFSKLDKDYSALMGQKVKVLFKNGKANEVIGVYATGDNKAYTVAANGTEKDGDKVKFNGTSYSVEGANGLDTYIDGVKADPTTLAQLDQNKLNPNMYTFVDTDDNNKLDTLIVKTYNVAKVTYAAADKIIANGKTYKTADENIAEGLKKDDWVVITQNLYKDQKDIVKAEVATAKLDALRDNGSGSVHFDGKASVSATWNEYKFGEQWIKGGDKVQSNLSENDLNSVKAGDNVEYVAVNGVMFYIKKASGDAVGKIADVAMVVNKGTTGINEEVKLAFFDGTTKTVKFDKDSGKKWDELKTGTVYEYSVSSEEYSFSDLKLDKEYYGDMTYMDSQTTSTDKKAFDKVGKYTIDDNAEVLLFLPSDSNSDKTIDKDDIGKNDSGNDFKKISGKQFKALVDGKVIAESTFYAFYGSMSGIDRVGALAVAVNDLDGIVKTWSNYGYIVTKPAKLDNKTIEYTFWNGTENVTVQEEKSNLNDRAKGTVIGYDTLTEKDGKKVIDDVDALAADQITFTAVTSVSDKKDTAIFAKQPVGATQAELDKVGNSNVFYIDTSADKDLEIGVKEGEIKAAQKSNDKYLANALVIGTKDEIELLIIDQGQYLDNNVYTVDPEGNVIDGEEANASAITIGTINSVAVGTPVDMNVTVDTKNIDKGTSVGVSLEKAAGLTATATDIDGNGQSIVTIKGTPQTADTATLKVTISGKEATKTFEISAAASNVVLKVNYDTTEDATSGTVKTYTGTVGYQNAWMLTPTVKVVDSQDADKTNDFTVTTTNLTLITDNNAAAKTFTVATKAATKVGDYKIVVTLGDKTVEQAIKVVAAPVTVIAAPTVTLTKIANGQNPTQAKATCTTDGVETNIVTEWYKAADTTGTKLGDSETVATGDTVSVKVILTAKAGYTFTGGTYDAVQLFGQKATATVGGNGTTLTLIVNNQTV